MDLKKELEGLASRIITESRGDNFHGMPLIINHYYNYNGENPYSNTPSGKYLLVDYQSTGGYCQVMLPTGPWIVGMKHLTYFGPFKENIETNEGAIHLLKGGPT